MKDPSQIFKISYLNSVWNFFIISNFKSNELNSKIFTGKIFSLTNKRVDVLSNWFKSIYRERAFSVKFCIKYINQWKFAILYCGIIKTTTVQMFIMILLTRIKSPLKELEASRLSKYISLSWKIDKTRNMEFLRRPLENMHEIYLTRSFHQRKDFCILNCRFVT